ncbi:hypothetical protein DMENIID0001_029650 [Sergentomyia squamirostris]
MAFDSVERDGEKMGWFMLDENSTNNNTLSPVRIDESFCKLVLYIEFSSSGVRIWDVVIFLPNVLFLLFLALRFNRARLKLRATSSPIFLTFYGIVWSCVTLSVLRCIVSMLVNATTSFGGMTDKIMWIAVRFSLLSAEMSVVIFGLAFGHLDSRNSIRAVLVTTCVISLGFSLAQGALDIVLPDDAFHIPSKDLDLFGHGGMLFLFVTSIIFATIYLIIFLLPCTRARDYLALPAKRSFYAYVATLCLLDSLQALGAGLLNWDVPEGLCLLNITSGTYFTFYIPLVYVTFLREFFSISQPTILFSYKTQVDDTLDDEHYSLPQQQSLTSLKTESDFICPNHCLFENTQFAANAGGNPLCGIQSPDSITGYSIESSSSIEFSGRGDFGSLIARNN